MNRAYVSVSSLRLSQLSDDEIIGRLASNLPFSLDPAQRTAWQFQINHVRQLASQFSDAHFFFEFLIPRMGRRADLVILQGGRVWVIEYKIGSATFDRSGVNQVYGYALDLKHFHETSHAKEIIPVLLATEAPTSAIREANWDSDAISKPLRLTPDDLAPTIGLLGHKVSAELLTANEWESGRYRPTPTIIEAAQALYADHDVHEISRSEAGAENLTKTAAYISDVIERSKANGRKSICFLTGVPGSGKTLAGLNLATERQQEHSDEHAVFLSGNGPLVAVLREALAQDAVRLAKLRGERASKAKEFRKTSAFIQNVHHFRDECLRSDEPPVEKVAVFDEAQRAWNRSKTEKFMKAKKGIADFAMSEPEFLLSAMNRHKDWCTIVCLVGGGQEINDGEAGIAEWLEALRTSFPNWQVHLSKRISTSSEGVNATFAEALHLSTSIRSFRAEKLSDFVERLLEGTVSEAKSQAESLTAFPLVVTRDIADARQWIRARRRANERAGMLASSNATRLKPHGIFVQHRIQPEVWFLNESDDVRSSDALEDVGTEFDVQGLEVDWACVCWDANLRREGGFWSPKRFSGTKWQNVNDEARRRYVVNAYRVLLTRARQGMVIFVPRGDPEDATRDPAVFDAIASYLIECGIPQLDAVTK